ncbi:MAG: HD domain-containing protein [Bacteroidales bacterium]
MKSSITERIEWAEERWLEQVRPYTAKLFRKTFIPSHDQGHHSRVWNFCKTLLLELERFNTVADRGLVEGLLLASWFHDTGMVRDPGENHGRFSREILRNFIKEAPVSKPVRFREVLSVIGHHDSKARCVYPVLKPGVPPGMMGVLSIADDLDALGIIGIYRYSEIYLKRGIPARLLGMKVLSNVKRRFKNIGQSCAAYPALTDSCLSDYHLIEQFFNHYNQQLLLMADPGKIQWGELGVVNHIRAFSVEAEVRPEEFTNRPEIAFSGGIVETYFKKLHHELEKTGS